MNDRSTTPDKPGTSADSETAVWKALSDPTRRRILDLLRNGPRTTGSLAGEFETSRYAVMKHLEVLTKAGLVVVTRRGRERHNHINPMPLQMVHERWITPLAADAARGLLRLKRAAELLTPRSEAANNPSKEPSMSDTEANNPSAPTDQPIQTVVEVSISAPPARVWDAFVQETDAWWRPDFRTDPKTRSVLLEAKVGGRLYEDYGEGDGLLWGTVVLIKTGERLDLVGVSGPEWGGPHTGYHSFTFQEVDDATVVRLVDTYHGFVSEKTRSSLEEGWKLLIGEGLKPYVEGKA